MSGSQGRNRSSFDRTVRSLVAYKAKREISKSRRRHLVAALASCKLLARARRRRPRLRCGFKSSERRLTDRTLMRRTSAPTLRPRFFALYDANLADQAGCSEYGARKVDDYACSLTACAIQIR